MRDNGPVLVPLDGSQLAEAAIPYAVALAKALGEQRLILLTVWEGNERDLGDAFPAIALELSEKADEYFTSYLKRIQASIGASAKVETMIATGAAASSVLRTADEVGARTIVIATHGRSGIGRWMYGSTAGRVIHESEVPVVVVGPQTLKRGRTEAALAHLMVPLDGSELSEAALPIARSLAEKVGARVTLVRAVPWAVQTYPFALPDVSVPNVDSEMESGAKEYLRKQEEKLKPLTVDAFVVRGAVAEGLIEVIEKQQVDLTIMTTRARAGLARAVLGSTAERVIQGSAPVLLIPPGALEA